MKERSRRRGIHASSHGCRSVRHIRTRGNMRNRGEMERCVVSVCIHLQDVCSTHFLIGRRGSGGQRRFMQVQSQGYTRKNLRFPTFQHGRMWRTVSAVRGRGNVHRRCVKVASGSDQRLEIISNPPRIPYKQSLFGEVTESSNRRSSLPGGRREVLQYHP